jgi:transcriptional regulator CtsR
MVQEESDLIEQYIASLSEKEKKAYIIAKEHLASSFDIEKSNGFLRFCAAKITEKV